MDYLNTVYSGLHKFLKLNTATLSGAVDIIVIQQTVPSSNVLNESVDIETDWRSEDHAKKQCCYFTSTPFHIRFGKTKLLNSSEHVVQIRINNKTIDLTMKLGPEGVAYFEQPFEEDLFEENKNAAVGSPQLNFIEKNSGYGTAFSDGGFMTNSSVDSRDVSDINPLRGSTIHLIPERITSHQGGGHVKPNMQMVPNVDRLASASNSPVQTSQSLEATPEPIGDVIWWWGNPEPRGSDLKISQLCRVESVLGSWALKNSLDLDSKRQIENLTKEIEDLDTALTLSEMKMGANTDRPNPNVSETERKSEKQGDAQGSSWGFLGWFKSRNPNKEKEEPTASVKEQLKLEELEILKRKGELLRAAQRRESERNLQNVMSSPPNTEDEDRMNKKLQSGSMSQPSSFNGDETLVKPGDQNQVLPAVNFDTATCSPCKTPCLNELYVGQESLDNLSWDEGGSGFDSQILDENHTDSFVESIEDMSTVTFEDKDCLTATEIEDINFNDLAKDLQPGVWGKVKISLCGHYLGRSMENNKNVFQSHLVTWEALCQNPSLVFDDRMVIMTNQRLYPGRVALPLILSTLAFQKPLSGETLAKLAMNDPFQRGLCESSHDSLEEDTEEKVEDCTQEKDENKGSTYQLYDRKKLGMSSSEDIGTGLASSLNWNDELQENENVSITNISQNQCEEKPLSGEPKDPILIDSSCVESNNECNDLYGKSLEENEKHGSANDLTKADKHERYSWLGTVWTRGSQNHKTRRQKRDTHIAQKAAKNAEAAGDAPVTDAKRGKSVGKARKSMNKTLKPTSDMLQCLKLKPGENQIEFVVNSKLQGKQSVKASIYLWRSDDKIVVSDVDGTITKSDVMGHCMPWVGNSWCHDGVARYFSDIEANGYRIMYLTSRSIGHAAMTREYLFNEVRQDGQCGNLEFLPSGPVIMAPDSLFTAVNRELIQRSPQQFKIPALQNVKDLFPKEYQPYAAAFGNRKTDLIAYNSVDIPIERIFIIDSTGAMSTANRDYNVTFSFLDTIVDVMFPQNKCSPAYSEFNDLVHWNQEFIEDPDDLSSLSECEDH